MRSAGNLIEAEPITDSEPAAAPVPEPEPLHRWTLVDLLIVGLGVIAVTLWAGILLDRFVTPTGDLLSTWGVIGALGLQSLGLIFSFGVLGALRMKVPLRALGFRSVSWTWLLIGIGAAAAAMPVRIAIGLFVLVVMTLLDPTLGAESISNPLLFPDVTLAKALSMTFIGGALIPIGEEMFFRGTLYRWLRNRQGIWVAALVSGALFGAAHMFPPTVAAAFVLGVVMALAYEYSGSLWVPILIHAVNNTAIFGLLYGSLLLLKWLDIPLPTYY